MPSTLEKAINKLDAMRHRFGGIFQNFANVLNMQNPNNSQNNPLTVENMLNKLEETKQTVSEITKQFQNPDLTTFICVCIPEFLSLYETERLIQKLAKYGIDSHNIVINQVLFPEKKYSM